MVSKPPALHAPSTLIQVSRRLERLLTKKTESHPLMLESAPIELDYACRCGENPNSEQRFLNILSKILPEQVNSVVPGKNYPVRSLLEHLAVNSIHDSVRLAAVGLLQSEIIVVQSDTAVPGAKPEALLEAATKRDRFPAFSRLPLRIQALELLREHAEGKRPDADEKDLRNAIECLKHDLDTEVASVLAHVASFSPHQSVKEKARAVLYEF